jgi:hypothetical protein
MPWSTMFAAPGRPSFWPMAKQWTMRAVAWIWRRLPVGFPAASRSKKPPFGFTALCWNRSKRALARDINQSRCVGRVVHGVSGMVCA